MSAAPSSINEEQQGWGDYFLRPILDFFAARLGRKRAPRVLKPIDLWADDPRLQGAISTVRMAAYPGENYQDVSARIEKEAKMYKEFLRNPAPIGKITLNTKRITPEARDGDITGDMYQVRDPVEGRAAVFYSFKRSPNLVLEFVVHDQHDEPLFPIVRTYSDWLGRKSFDLGAGRTFDLNMTEGECPGMVRVRAGFTNARGKETNDSDLCFANGGLPLASGDEDDVPRKAKAASGWSYGTRVALTFGIECLILFVFGWAFLRLALTQPVAPAHALAEAFNNVAAAPLVSAATNTNDGATFVLGDENDTSGWQGDNVDTVPAEATPVARQNKDGDKGKVTRIAAVTGGRVKMDEGFCRRFGERCHEWRANMQSMVDAVNALADHRAGAPTEPKAGGRPQNEPVSRTSSGAASGPAQVTFLLADAFFLLRETNYMEFGSDGCGTKESAEAVSPVLPWHGIDLCRRNETNEWPAGGNSVPAAEGKVKTSDAE